MTRALPKISLERILAERHGDTPDDNRRDNRRDYHREYMRQYRKRQKSDD